MFGLSSSGKDQIASIVEELFDNIALQLIGAIPEIKGKKSLIISSRQNYGLPELFVQAMANKPLNAIEADSLKSFLSSANGYINTLKSKAKTNIAERIDSLARDARLKDTKMTAKDVNEIVSDEMGKAKSHMKAIAEAESTKVRNLGTLMNISRLSAQVGDNDPTVYFIVVRDGQTCEECVKIHLMPDKITPRLWKFSDLSHGYHKRGEDHPSISGLHPHCFVGDTKLHTSRGLVSLEELFLSQDSVEVFVDGRIKNRKYPANQFGEPIPGSALIDRHTSGARSMPATNVYDTGVQECVKITLDNGFSISVSNGHEMWIDNESAGVKIKAEDLKIGQKIPVISGKCGFGNDHFPELAELMGNLMGDGCIGKNTAQWNFFDDDLPYGEFLYSLAKQYRSTGYSPYKEKLPIHPSDEKYKVAHAKFNSKILKSIFVRDFGLSKKPRTVPQRLWMASAETVAAFLRGLYAADGHVEKSPGIVLAQNDLNFLQEVQLLLSNFGLISSINPHGEERIKTITYANGERFVTKRKACWRLNLGGWDQCAIFAKEIGMGVPAKNERLQNFLSETEGKTKHGAWRTSRVAKIEPLGKLQTYCLTEPMTNTVTANGFVTGNCRCSLTYLAKGYGFTREGRIEYHSAGFDAYEKRKAKKP